MKKKIAYLTNSKTHLGQFLSDLEQPANKNIVYLLSKYKYASEAYE